MKTHDYDSLRLGLPAPFAQINVMRTYASFRMEPHRHDVYHVNRVMEGSVRVLIEGKEHEVGAGCIFVLPPNIPHALFSQNGYLQIGTDVRCAEDGRGFFSELKALCSGFISVRLPLSAESTNAQVERMLMLIRNPTVGNTMRAVHLIEGQMLDLFERMRGEEEDAFLKCFSAMISEGEPWMLSLSEMCRRLSLSRTQLERQAHRAFGCGASEYCARLRYARICELLHTTDLTLDRIAAETGFCDAAHLSKFFVHRAGISPGRYRASVYGS